MNCLFKKSIKNNAAKIIQFLLISLIPIALICTGCSRTSTGLVSTVEVSGVDTPTISLNGVWKFSMDPIEGFWKREIKVENWDDIQVPGECAMQGFPIQHDIPYVYKTKFQIPSDFKDKIIKLKFDGVYSYARVWINGKYASDHKGGFTSWECDITKLVESGEEVWLTVEITDKKDDLSYGSGYAKHQIGGILRSVWLLALPKNYLEYLYIETDLDNNYENANLNIQVKTSNVETAFIKFQLFDNKGNINLLNTDSFEIGHFKRIISLNIIDPKKWDAEHPNLYTLKTNLFDKNNNLTFTKTQKVGFREIEIVGNKLLVNGRPVKLRGACRHDIHPLLGRISTPEYDREDVLLAKEANMNFIRTSHYPPTEKFLEYCDQFGIYVEDESAVCFVNTHRMNGYRELRQSGPEFEAQYISQVREMVHNHRNHPSVIIWSIGNESKYDIHLQKSYDYIKAVDPTRPVISSYPGMVPDSVKCYDILSMHYPKYTGNMGPQYGISIRKFEYDKMPVLFDEWAHVACYNLPTLRADPNVRDFWGRSLDSMWINLFDSEGGLGGAIWGFVDETFMLPENMIGYNEWWGIQEYKTEQEVYKGPTVGYGEWGIIDTWRRKKPEFWQTKKAYSPTRILIKSIKNFEPNKEIKIPVLNRFDHTNFNELKIEWEYLNQNGTIESLNIEPHKSGEIIIPGNEWLYGQHLIIKFYNHKNELIDRYNLLIGDLTFIDEHLENANLELIENDDLVIISNSIFKVNLNKTTGLLESLVSNKDTMIISGPFLNLIAFEEGDWATKPFKDIASNWKLLHTEYKRNDVSVNINTIGKFEGNTEVNYSIKVEGSGLFLIEYSIRGIPTDKYIRESGLRFKIGKEYSKMNWKRDSYWTTYPALHLGMQEGEIDFDAALTLNYREYPNHPWEYDMSSFFYHGINYESKLSNIALSTKENIYSFELISRNGAIFQINATGDKSCRLSEENSNYLLHVNDKWDYASLMWGNYQKNIKFEDQLNGKLTISIK